MKAAGSVADTAAAEQRGAADPTASVWVAASAGTGKTKVLTDRVLALLLTDTQPHKILCLTYTKAAAAEMQTRLAARLSDWATASEADLDRALFDVLGREASTDQRELARRLFALVLDAPGGLTIQTIHSFCQSLLGRFPLEAGIAPHFSVLDDRDAQVLMKQARDFLFRMPPDPASRLQDALAVVTRHLREGAFADLVKQITDQRRAVARFLVREDGIDGAIRRVCDHLCLVAGETDEAVVASACADRMFDGSSLRLTVNVMASGTKTDRERAETVAAWLSGTRDQRVEQFGRYTSAFLRFDGGQPSVRKRLITTNPARMLPEAAPALQREAERLLAVVLRRRAVATAEATAALLIVGHTYLEVYRRLKASRSFLDYDDLITLAATLMEQECNASWVLYKLDGGIDHVLIDEAQDTSPAQWQVIKALTGDFFAGAGARTVQRTVFAVGDVKQSIFSFQGAEPAEFIRNRAWFGERIKAARENWRPMDLNWSFRSTRAVLSAVDAVFARPEAAEGVALDHQAIVHQAWRLRDGGSVEVWPLLVPRDRDPVEPWAPPIARVEDDSPQIRCARLVARRIARMIRDGEPLVSRGRPIRAGDIMVLVRRRTPFVEALVRGLKWNDIPVTGVDRMMLLAQMAVIDLVGIGRFTLLPSDDLTLAAVLRSPLVGLSEEQLFTLAHDRTGSLWRSMADRLREDSDIAQAHRLLSDLLAIADGLPPFEFYSRLLGPMGGRQRLLARLGNDAEDPITEFLDLALAYERTQVPSLQGFLHWIDATQVEIKRDLEHGEPEAVRIITVHGAKGLQAPIVFLPDTVQTPQHPSGLIWSTLGEDDDAVPLWPPRTTFNDPVVEAARERRRRSDMEEYRRLLYVAMTRARDRLIVCGWLNRNAARSGLAPDESWYGLIRAGLTAAAVERRVETVEDPILEEAVEFDGPARILRIVHPQDSPPVADAGFALNVASPAAVPEWALTPAPLETAPPRPLAPSRTGREPPVRPPLGDGGGRLRRGRLVHRLLQSLPDLAPEKRINAAHLWLARTVPQLDSAERQTIAAEVLAILDDREFGPLFAAGSLAEVPITGRIGDHLITGQIDRLIIGGDRILILDYKTDRPAPSSPKQVSPVYLRQMAAYRAVLGAIYPGRSVRCALLWTEHGRLMPLDDALLRSHAP
jgi:ATP-dependent helicase/nuclease subunit A